MNDIRTSKNIRERPVDEMLKEYRQNQEMDRIHAKAMHENEQRQRQSEKRHYRQYKISELQKKQEEIREKENLRKLQRETSLSSRVIKRLREEKQALQKIKGTARQPVKRIKKQPIRHRRVAKMPKHKKYVVIDGVAYPVARTQQPKKTVTKKPRKKSRKKKSDEITF